MAFYCDLFGWTVAEFPIGPDGTYSMFQTRGLDLGAAYTIRDEELEAAPPHWNAYVTVEDADAAAVRAQELGGTVIAPPFDVMDLGRMAIIHWMPYFQVTDVDATAAKAKALGAQVHAGPQDIPNAGRFVVLGDPQGAVFAAFQMRGI